MRQGHLDIARAISIVLVVMGHGPLATHHPDWHLALSNLRMPLLLMLAGMQLRPTTRLWATARDKADVLLKPYLVMAVVLGFYAWLKGDLSDPGAYAADVLSFNGLRMPGWLFPLWFLTLLWALHVGVSALLRQHPNHLLPKAETWALVGALGALGYMGLPSSGLDPHRCVGSGLGYSGWIFNLDLWALGAAWFLAGHLVADAWRDDTPHLRHTLLWTACCCVIVLGWRPSLDMLMREADQPWASAAASFSGAWAIVGWSRLLQRWALARHWLAPVGRFSLYILLIHAPLQSALRGGLSRFMPDQLELASWIGVPLVLGLCVEWGRQTQGHASLMALFEPLYRLPMHRMRTGSLPKPASTAATPSAPAELRPGAA